MLTERGFKEIELSDGKKIGLRFSTWTIKRFCELNGNLTLPQYLQKVVENEFTMAELISLILCGAETYCKSKKMPFAYTDFDVSEWIDDLGGIGSEKLSEIFGLHVQSLTDESTEPHNKEGEASETKSN